jgi:diguanylate cyclase (GGDEF)-like protein
MKFPKLRGNKQYLLVISLLGVLFLAVLVAGLYATITSANDVERQRTARLAELAIKAQLNSLKSATEENAYWDEAADNIYRGTNHQAFFERNWLPSTEENDRYELIAIVDHNGKPIVAGENGALATLESQRWFGAGTEKLLASLRGSTESAASLIQDDGEVAILAASNIRYTDAAMNAMHVKKRPYRIMFKKRMDQKLVAAMGGDMGIPGLTLGSGPAGRPSIILFDGHDRVIGQLSWNTPNAGYVAAWQSLPILLAGSLFFFIVLGIIARFGFNVIGRLAQQALTDSLSNMPNRRALRQAIRAKEYNGQPYALALIDLDGFKNVNDSYGHAVGDRLIRKISDILQKNASDDGLIARLGGDEFAILLRGISAKDRIEKIASGFIQRLQYPVMIEERSISVGASIGLVATNGHDIDDGEVLRRADVAMYSAKRHGKMRAEWFDPQLDEEQTIANELANELRISLANDELEVVYQPIVEVGGSQCESVEALARWISPTRGPISPDVFIPIAENTGLIDTIGLFVLRRACSDVRDWNGLKLAVNVSAAQLRNPMFPIELSKILNETGFAASRLELEITETYLIADTALAQKVIEGVTALGVTISLDDFGTGYASIGFLRQFAFGKLKIDRSLVKEAQHDEAARMLVQVSIAAARALNMVVTAEGVETEAQADLMRVAGCDQLQGWYFGRPMENHLLLDFIQGDISGKGQQA